MKTVFAMINLVGGILVLLLGAAAILNETHSPQTALVGLVAVALAGFCLWLASEFIAGGPNPMA